jgi:predicted Zn-dependent protease
MLKKSWIKQVGFTFLLALAGVVFYGVGCQTVPHSGRRQFLMTSEEEENRLGREAWAEIHKQHRTSTDAEKVSAVKRVGRDIAEIAGKPNYDWEFTVFESDEPNAFCLPGGKIAVYTGLFKYLKNDSELAAVVGHEVAHAVARHAGERMTHAQVQAVGQQVLAASVKSNPDRWMLVYGLATQTGVILPYSREHEYEADYLGLLYMAKAGYHPRGALNFWERFSELSSTGPIGEYFSTHPMSSKRMEKMQEHMPEALDYYRNAPNQRDMGKTYGKN